MSGPKRRRGEPARRRLHSQVAHEIGGRIMRGELPPGSALPNETEYSAQFSVSRTALREAIKLLAAKGMVESRPKTGTRVRPRDQWNMLDPDLLGWQMRSRPVDAFAADLFEIRRIIEPEAAALAATRASHADVAKIQQAYDDMERLADDYEAFSGPDLRFHLSILDATGNELLRPLGALIETALESSFRITNSRPGGAVDSLPRHKAVLDMIAAHDPHAARRAMKKLLDDSIRDLESIVGLPVEEKLSKNLSSEERAPRRPDDRS
jgi:DNA-binding FadR family transcriptional regulator